MLRDRYDPIGLVALVREVHLEVDPELAQLDRLLEDDVSFEQVKAALARRYPQTARTGRPSTSVEVILRLLVVKQLCPWSYAQAEYFVNDRLVLRQFCRLGLAPVPDDTTLLRGATCLQSGTLHQVLDRVTELARSRKVTRGRKRRRDSTVVETAVHHPSDSTLLADGVGVLSRRVQRANGCAGDGAAAGRDRGRELWRDRPRGAKRLARRIGERMARTLRRGGGAPAGDCAGARERRARYARLVAVARASRRQAERVRELVAAAPADAPAGRLRAARDRVGALVARVITQAEWRVLRGERGPAAEKGLRLFEPHTALIRRGKARQPTEFGAKIVLDEVEGGLVTRYTVCAGNPDDAAGLLPGLAHHRERCGRPPDLLAADRHCFSTEHCRQATTAGVRRGALPTRGPIGPADRARERAPWFRRGHRCRAGIEGRISVLRRRFGLRRCRYHGPAGLERWVGLGRLAHHLRVISRGVSRRPAASARPPPRR
jgi:IS5 family transposase